MIYRTFIIAALLVFTYGCSDSNNDDGFGLSPVDPPVPTDCQPASPARQSGCMCKRQQQRK